MLRRTRAPTPSLCSRLRTICATERLLKLGSTGGAGDEEEEEEEEAAEAGAAEEGAAGWRTDE
jgi:hypothetical protein